MPAKDSHIRIKLLTLASGHGRYGQPHITVTPERTLLSVGEWPLHVTYRYKFVTVSILKIYVTGVSLLKPPLGSRSGFIYLLELLESSLYNTFPRRVRWVWLLSYRNVHMRKMPRGELKLNPLIYMRVLYTRVR
jgi:hypothetical protein